MSRVVVEIAFLALAATVWGVVYGYPLSLLLARRTGARRRHPPRLPERSLPPVSVVVATLDERERIGARLDDLARTEYPSDRIRTVVVDGGSTDGTPDLVRPRTGPRLRLLELGPGAGKSAQIAAALATIDDPVVVISDADARLAPDCIRGLVEALVADPRAALVGARVVPETELAEERLHWALVGKLSWLEGEVLGAATPSGVALAFRRETLALSPAALCDDVHLAVAAGTSGRRVKLAWHSVAFESRSADTAAGLLALRRRRGLAFRGELARARAAGGASRGFRLVRAVRMLLFDVVPWALLGLALLGLGLTAAGSHRLTAAVALAFAAPLAGFAAAAALERRPPAGALPLRGLGGRLFAPLRWAALSLVALVTLRFRVGPSGEAL